ncbi:hypothetical protein [Antricoccus suffuscus]|uniref:hypothetical protein n=1 Tax=Antricoccus suffuscus TaxID=1629062 RepID=UPI000D071AF4|nr:hypothetical protein [Antricoccus suffuscus]
MTILTDPATGALGGCQKLSYRFATFGLTSSVPERTFEVLLGRVARPSTRRAARQQIDPQ